MNAFDEHTWSAEQRALDAQICAEFEGFEAHFAAHGALPAAEAQTLVARIDCLVHEGRRAHWAAELARLGVATEPAATDVAPPKSRGGRTAHG